MNDTTRELKPVSDRSTGGPRARPSCSRSGALLIAGGVAVVSAASPDPSASAAPGATTQPSDNGGTAPRTRDGHLCPEKGSGGSGTPGSGTPTPTPTPDSSAGTPSSNL